VTGSTSARPAAFPDHFSRDSNAYARFRPRYPAALFAWLAALPPARRLAWDAATGNGQAATMLAPHFARVVASDPSRAQLRAADRVPALSYLVAAAEASALAPGRVELVTVAQAFHWLDRPRFFQELDRIMAPGGVLAVWCYGLLQAFPEIDAAIGRFYEGVVGPYWPLERVNVDQGYRNYVIPIDEVPAPPLAIAAELDLSELLGYIRTWSAVGRYLAARGSDPVEPLEVELAGLWGDPGLRRPIVWPLSIRAGRWLGARAAA
jgi:SAM-dependent methyltransferase